MSTIKINNKTYPATVTLCASDHLWSGRAVKSVTLEMTPDAAAQVWTDGADWAIISADGVEIPQTEYAKAGTITDHRDGRVTVKMGRYTPAELAEIAYGGVPASRTEAQSIRPVARRLARGASDEEAAVVRGMYPSWAELVAAGETVASGARFIHGNTLYKVRQDHTPSAAWVPGGTESLYEVIDERHDGSSADPIPYRSGMTLEYGMVYSDGGVKYICTRPSGQPVYHALADLVGAYVEAVS